MENQGYIQTFFAYIWRLIKASLAYRILTSAYNAISCAWQKSVITGWFRSDERAERAVSNSLAYKAVRRVSDVFELLNKKMGELINKTNENSFIVRGCNYLLHNLLALNLKFIGYLSGFAVLAYSVLCLVIRGQAPGIFTTAVLVVSVILTFADVNVTHYIGSSALVKFIGYCAGCELSFDFYYKTRCKDGLRIVWAVVFGLIAGGIAALIPANFKILFVSVNYGILFILGLAFVCLVLYKVQAGVFFTVFLAPIMPTMAMAGLSLLCLFSLVIKSLTTRNFKWRFDILGFLIALLMIVFLASAITSFTPVKSIQIWLIYFSFMSFYFVLTNVIQTKKQLFSLLTLFVISGCLVGLYGLMQYYFNLNVTQAWIDEEMFEGIKMRIYSTLENPNVLGEYLLLVIPVCVAFVWTKTKWLQKGIFAGIAGMLMLALIYTFSRGCWVAIMVTAAVYITFVQGKLWGLALIALPFIPMFIPQTVLQRFTSIGDLQDSSSSYRMFIWLGSLAMMKDFWISGLGLGTDAFNAVYPFYSYSAVYAPHSHNLFLQLWVENGIAGLVLFLIVLLYFFKKLIGAYQAGGRKADVSIMSAAIGAAVVGFLVQGMFDHGFYNYRVFFIFWIVLAMGRVCGYVAREEVE